MYSLVRFEASSSGVASVAGSGVVGDGELGCELCCGVVADGVSVEVAGFVGFAGGGDGPGPAGEFAGGGGVGRDVVVAAFDHEPPVMLSQLGIATPSDVGCLVESEPEFCWALFGDPS